ncbi:hypothetical protein HNQ95_006642 [Aminobacter ciceronei]|uniref:Transposase n=2 Tax=Aminobacter TaxID=31988 RepID=A0ABR6CJP1_9HYPH|nr:hypothetical protein [Aminobacter ciceronei]MBA9024597.1 hypothetical protein [Aminobacter ciceronei]
MPMDNNLLERDIGVFATGRLAVQRYTRRSKGQREAIRAIVSVYFAMYVM